MAPRLTIRLGGEDEEWRADPADSGVAIEGVAGAFAVTDLGDGHFRAEHDGAVVDGVAARAGDVVWVGVDGDVFACEFVTSATRRRGTSRDQDALSPPMSATVVRVLVKAGDLVSAGDVLVVLEAMKMELSLRAPRNGTVRSVHCRDGEIVSPGRALVDLT